MNVAFPIGTQLLNDAKARGSMPRAVVNFWLQHMVVYLASADVRSAVATAQNITDPKLRALLLISAAARWDDQMSRNAR